ncbi:MAG: hypothetical protein ACK5O2_04080 [Microthrixaceae bacterium]
MHPTDSALRPTDQEGARAHPNPGSPHRSGHTPPGWFDRLTVGLATFFLAASIGALGLGALGALGPATAVLCLGAASSATWWVDRRMPRHGHVSRAANVGAACALLIATGSAVWASWDASEHLLIDRDPGSYVTTAKWLTHGNGLGVRDPLAAFGGSADLDATSTAVYPNGSDLEFQFMHLPAAMSALTGSLLGDTGLLLIGGVIGATALLAIYSVMVRLTAAPLLSLLAPLALAVSMPFVAVVRDVYSEPFVLLFTWVAIVLMAEVAGDSSRRHLAALAGVFLGTTLLARVDSIPTIAVAATLVTAWVIHSTGEESGRRSQAARAGVRSAALVGLIALVDLFAASQSYARSLRSNLVLLWAATAVVALACRFALKRRDTVSQTVAKVAQRPRVARFAAGGVAVTLVLLWVVRPWFDLATGSTPGWFRITEWQAAEGLAIDETRTYAEQSMRWMSWYLGPVALALAIGGVAWAVYRILRGTARTEVVMVTTITLTTGLMYWLRPSIFPDQIWATRRFLPVVIPGLLVMATFGIRELATRLPARWWRRVVLVTLGALVVVPPLSVTLRAPLMSEQAGMRGVIEDTCDLLGEDAAVVVVGELDQRVLPQTLRSWCDVPVAIVDSPGDEVATSGDDATGTPSADTPAIDIAAVARQVSEQGRTLKVVTSDSGMLDRFGPTLATTGSTRSAASGRRLEHTLSRAPSRYLEGSETVTVPAQYSLVVAEAIPG